MPSENVENYLKRIYTTERAGERVSTTLLSEKLRISPASVTEMVKRLAGAGHVVYTPYRGVQMTAKGKKRALQIIRRHRLWELFLVKVLKFQWDEIHEEAERLEHITSERMERRLDELLGFPTIDPHGDLIPSPEGELQDKESVSLAEVGPSAVVVRRVSDENKEILTYASRLGMTLNTPLKVKEKIPFDGSLRVEIGGKEVFVSSKLAENIFVEVTRRGKRKKNVAAA